MIRAFTWPLLWLAPAMAIAQSQSGDDRAGALKMSKPVVCLKVHGFASFEALPAATLTPDDKLMVYYEPSGYTIEKTGDGFRAAFLQDGRIRKKGSKDALWKKDRMIDYEAKSPSPPYQIYLRSDVSIKGFPPGEYELDMILRDGLAKDKDASVTRTVGFRVVPSPDDDAGAKVEPAAKKKP